MPNAKPKQSCRVHVSLLFKKEIALLKPISFERAFPNCSADRATVTNKGIRIAFERTRKVSGAKIFGKTRIDYIRWIILLLSCLEDNPFAPSVASISYSLNEDTPKNLKIPEELQQTITEYSGIHFPYTTIDKALKSDCSSEALKIAISYCWIASKAISQEERLKLLWGAFNALYRWYGKSQNLKTREKSLCLTRQTNYSSAKTSSSRLSDNSIRRFETLYGRISLDGKLSPAAAQVLYIFERKITKMPIERNAIGYCFLTKTL